MNHETHYRKLERMYLRANINTALFPSTRIRIEKGWSEVQLDITDEYHHALGALHGSVYFKLLDDAAFFAANSMVKDVFVLTASFHIEFLRPVSVGGLKAVGKLISTGDQHLMAGSAIYNADGKKIGFGEGEFAYSKVQLSKDIGYY